MALANAEAFGEDPAADLVNEGDVLLSLGENEIGGLEEQAVRELLAGTRDGDIVLEFARRFVRASGAELENFSIVVQSGHGEQGAVDADTLAEDVEVVDISSKALKKKARQNKEKELLERRKAKGEEKNQTVSVESSSYLKQLAQAPPVWEPPGRPCTVAQHERGAGRGEGRGTQERYNPVKVTVHRVSSRLAGGDFLSSLGAGEAGQTTAERLKQRGSAQTRS